jgi:hypothetical protein
MKLFKNDEPTSLAFVYRGYRIQWSNLRQNWGIYTLNQLNLRELIDTSLTQDQAKITVDEWLEAK